MPIKKIQIIGHVVNKAFILIKDYINPESKKSIHYIIMMVFVLLNWHWNSGDFGMSFGYIGVSKFLQENSWKNVSSKFIYIYI